MDKEIIRLRQLYWETLNTNLHDDWCGELYDVICRLEQMAVTLGIDLPRDNRFNHHIYMYGYNMA